MAQFTRFTAAVLDDQGNAVTGARIEVKDENTGFLAVIYADPVGAQVLPNPFIATESTFFFHTSGGDYRVKATKGELIREWRWVSLGNLQSQDAEDLIVTLQSGIIPADTKEGLDNQAPDPENPDQPQLAGVVYADPDPALNGYYIYDYTLLEWVWLRPLPDTLATLTLVSTEGGQLNMQSSPGVDPASVRAFIADVGDWENPGPVTVSVDGGDPVRALNYEGEEFAPGTFQPRMFFTVEADGTLRSALPSDILAQAMLYRDYAKLWAESPDPIPVEAGGGPDERSAKWWAQNAGATLANLAARSFVGDGVTTRFALIRPIGVAPNAIVWFGNGAHQRPGVDYTVDGADLVFETPPPDGMAIDTLLIANVSEINTPVDGSVTAGSISDDPAEQAAIRQKIGGGSASVVSLNDYATGDGETNDLAGVIAAANYANARDLKLVGNGRFKLVGSGSVVVTTDADFSGCVFDASEWTGRFVFDRKEALVTYGPTDTVVTALEGSSNLGAGASRFDGWDDVSEVNDAFVIIETGQDFYTYRGETIKRREFNRVYKDGVVCSPLKYSLSGVDITGVLVYPLEKRRRKVVGLTLDITGNDTATNYVRVQTSLLDIEVKFIQGTAPYVNVQPSLVSFGRCFDIKARLDFQWANRSEGYMYGLLMNECMEMDITIKGDGDGWGINGSNSCKRVTFRNGIASRIDFHQPFHDWLRLRDMVVGDWGVLVTALGDLDLDGVEFHQRTLANLNNSGIIRSRTDTGGFADGDLILNNVKVISDDNSGDVELLEHRQSAGNPKPAGSPIVYRWWRRIRSNNLRAEIPSPNALKFSPTEIQSGDAVVSVCEEFTVRDAGGRMDIIVHLTGLTSSLNASGLDFNLAINVENFDGRVVSVQGDGTIKVLASYNNVRGTRTSPCRLIASAPGTYVVTGGELYQVSFGSSGPSGNVTMAVYGAKIKKAGANPLVLGVTALADLSLVDCEFLTDDQSDFDALLAAILVRPRLSLNGTKVRRVVTNIIDGAGTLTFPVAPREGQIVNLKMGTSTGDEFAEVPITIPPVGERVIVPGYHQTTGSALGVMRRATSTTLEALGDVRYRYVSLPSV